MDQSKKTMRHFYCRDVLWETFEQMANDFDCSIDYLINEAMRYYARSKNYQSAQATGSEFRATSGTDGRVTGLAPAPPPAAVPTVPSVPFPTGGPPVPQQPPLASASAAVRRIAPPPPPAQGRPMPPSSGAYPGQSAMGPPMNGGMPMPGGMQGGMSPGGVGPGGMPGMQQPRRPMPPPPRPAPEAMAPAAPTLYLVFNNQKISIDKDQFIIGRGSKTSDLPIKDGNISRKHAAVIRRNGTYYIKDLGSTNGIDFKGMRIDNKRIDEGDVFHLCDYELRFTYRA